VKAIYVSIKPKYLRLICLGEKSYEFRNYLPKQPIDTLFVYETRPSGALKYIIKIEKIIEYPEKIPENGLGNHEFNCNKLQSKYAYQIKEVLRLEKPILLKELKEKYNFYPPQSYSYDQNNVKLTNYLKKAKKIVFLKKAF